MADSMDELIAKHNKAMRPNDEPFLMKKADGSGIFRTLKASVLKVQYYKVGEDTPKTKQLSFAKLNGCVDNGTIPHMVGLLSQMVDSSVLEITDASLQSNFIFTDKENGHSVVEDEIDKVRDAADKNKPAGPTE